MMKWSGRGASGALVRVAEDSSSGSDKPSWNVNTFVPIPYHGKMRRMDRVTTEIIFILCNLELVGVLSKY